MALKAKLLGESSNAPPAAASESRQKWEADKGEELHKLREQMVENERLLKESQKSWEDKLKDAHSSSTARGTLSEARPLPSLCDAYTFALPPTSHLT